MRAWICQLIVLLSCALTPSLAWADMHTGKVFTVVENQLTVMASSEKEQHRFDLSNATVLRDGLQAKPSALLQGDWVTVTTEMQDGRPVATLVEASSNR